MNLSVEGVKNLALRRGLVAGMAVGWLFVVVLAYFVFHKPFDLANVLAIANTFGDLIVVGLLLTLAAAIGHRILRAFDFSSILEMLVIQTGVGLGMVAFAVFALGWLGVLKPLVLWAFLAAGLALLFRDVLALGRVLRTLALPLATRGERALALWVAFALLIALLFALAPPTGWDSLQYHLVLPKLALQNGRFLTPPDNLSLSNPSLVQMLFLAAMGLRSDAAAQVIHWSFLVLTIGALLSFAARYFTWRVGWFAAALLVAVPSLLLISTYAYNDAALMLFTLTAFLWTLRALESQRACDFILAGALAGLALGEKYTAFIVPLALALLVLFHGGLRAPPKRAWRDAFVLCSVAFVFLLPWLARNVWLVGNPVYPFVFGGRYWDSWRAAWYSRFGTGLLSQPLQLFATPWTMTVQGDENGIFDATIGPLLLALLPFNLFHRTAATRAAPTRTIWVFVTVLFAFWLLGVAQSKLLFQTRLLFPAFPLLALLAAEGWNRLEAIALPQFSAQRFASLVIALVLGLNAIGIAFAALANRPWDVLVGVESREQLLARSLGGYYTMARWVNENLPGDARILALWEPRAYYIDRAMEPDAILDRWAHLQFLYGDADAIAAEWRRQGITHVLLFRAGLSDTLRSGYDPVDDAALKTLAALEAKYLQLVYDRASLGLTTQDGKPALAAAEAQPYAVYELK